MTNLEKLLIKLAEACKVMREALEDAIRTNGCAIGDLEHNEVIQNDTLGMCRNLDKEMLRRLKQVEKILGGE